MSFFHFFEMYYASEPLNFLSFPVHLWILKIKLGVYV